jgi:hypothetical protein
MHEPCSSPPVRSMCVVSGPLSLSLDSGCGLAALTIFQCRFPIHRDDAHHPPTELVSRSRLGIRLLSYNYCWSRCHLFSFSAFSIFIPHRECLAIVAGPENGEHFNGDMSPGDVTGSDSPAKTDVEAGHGTDVVRFNYLIDICSVNRLSICKALRKTHPLSKPGIKGKVVHTQWYSLHGQLCRWTTC